MSHHTGRSVEQVERDLDRDFFMTAEEAKEYGLIDDIIPRRGLAAPCSRGPWRSEERSSPVVRVSCAISGLRSETPEVPGRRGQCS